MDESAPIAHFAAGEQLLASNVKRIERALGLTPSAMAGMPLDPVWDAIAAVCGLPSFAEIGEPTAAMWNAAIDEANRQVMSDT